MPQGKIKKLVTDRGFGFIATEGQSRGEIFFHLSVVQGTRYDDLQEGQLVEYELETDPGNVRSGKGPRAATVRVL